MRADEIARDLLILVLRVLRIGLHRLPLVVLLVVDLLVLVLLFAFGLALLVLYRNFFANLG